MKQSVLSGRYPQQDSSSISPQKKKRNSNRVSYNPQPGAFNTAGSNSVNLDKINQYLSSSHANGGQPNDEAYAAYAGGEDYGSQAPVEGHEYEMEDSSMLENNPGNQMDIVEYDQQDDEPDDALAS